jgi:hypothetical protein
VDHPVVGDGAEGNLCVVEQAPVGDGLCGHTRVEHCLLLKLYKKGRVLVARAATHEHGLDDCGEGNFSLGKLLKRSV